MLTASDAWAPLHGHAPRPRVDTDGAVRDGVLSDVERLGKSRHFI